MKVCVRNDTERMGKSCWNLLWIVLKIYGEGGKLLDAAKSLYNSKALAKKYVSLKESFEVGMKETGLNDVTLAFQYIFFFIQTCHFPC